MITMQDVMSETVNTQKRWIDTHEMESEFGFSRSFQSKARMASNSSTLPYSKIGKFIRYDRLEIDKWLENHQVQGHM